MKRGARPAARRRTSWPLPSPSPVVAPDTSPRSSNTTSTPRACSSHAAATPTIPAPTTATSQGLTASQREAGRERVAFVEQVLPHAGDPRAAGDLGHHRGHPADLGLVDEPAGEARADDRLVDEVGAQRELA